MAKELEAQIKVGVCVEALWRAMSKDLCHVMQKAAPDLVKDAQIIEGDGGLGTVLLIHFGTDVAEHISYQKEKIVELDETNLRIGLQVIEGGHLDHGFTSYITCFQLTGVGDRETLADFKMTYELAGGRKFHITRKNFKIFNDFHQMLGELSAVNEMLKHIPTGLIPFLELVW